MYTNKSVSVGHYGKSNEMPTQILYRIFEELQPKGVDHGFENFLGTRPLFIACACNEQNNGASFCRRFRKIVRTRQRVRSL